MSDFFEQHQMHLLLKHLESDLNSAHYKIHMGLEMLLVQGEEQLRLLRKLAGEPDPVESVCAEVARTFATRQITQKLMELAGRAAAEQEDPPPGSSSSETESPS